MYTETLQEFWHAMYQQATALALAQAALQLLLAKETKLLQTIGRLRVNALHENKDIKTQKELDGMAQPKTWELRNGVKVRLLCTNCSMQQTMPYQFHQSYNWASSEAGRYVKLIVRHSVSSTGAVTLCQIQAC